MICGGIRDLVELRSFWSSTFPNSGSGSIRPVIVHIVPFEFFGEVRKVGIAVDQQTFHGGHFGEIRQMLRRQCATQTGMVRTASGEIRDVQPTWASLSPSVINIDPLTGFARSVGPGVVKLVAQAGDATDTVSITVQPSAGMAMPTDATVAGIRRWGPSRRVSAAPITFRCLHLWALPRPGEPMSGAPATWDGIMSQ